MVVRQLLKVPIMSSDKREEYMKSGTGRVVDRGTAKYSKIFVYVPRLVSADSSFPFQSGEEVTVTIEGERLIIEKRKEKGENL